MRRCKDFSNFFFARKTLNSGAHFEPTFNSLDLNAWEKSTTAETSKFGLSIFSKNCLRHFWRSGLRFSRATRRGLKFDIVYYTTPQNRKKSNSCKLFFGPIINRYRRGLETCPQANLAKSGRKYFLLFFPTRPSDDYDSAPSRKYSCPLLDVFACIG